MGAKMKSHGWLLLIPVIAFIALGLVRDDARWYIMALMLVFIIGPMAMSMIYTSYMLTPEVRRAVLPKRIIITPGESLRLEYVSRRELAIENGEDKDVTDEKLSPQNENIEKLPEPEEIAWSEIANESSTSTHKVYRLKGRLQFILIPWTAYPRQ